MNVTPAIATSLASTANSMKPWQAMDVTRMASSLAEVGAGSFIGAFANLSQTLKAQDFGFKIGTSLQISNLTNKEYNEGSGSQLAGGGGYMNSPPRTWFLTNTVKF